MLKGTHMCQLDLTERTVFVVDRYALHCIQSRVSTIDDFAEYCIFGVEMRLLGIGDEELGFIRVWSRVGHGHHPACVELKKIIMLRVSFHH